VASFSAQQHQQAQAKAPQQNGVSKGLMALGLLMFAVLALPATRILRRRGLRGGLLVAAALHVAGAASFVLSWPSSADDADSLAGPALAWSVIAALLASMAQLLVLCAPVLLAQASFGAHERVLATALGGSASALGTALACMLNLTTFGESLSGDGAPSSVSSSQTMLHRLAIGELVIAALVALAVLKWFEDRPPSPPSFAAAASVQQPSVSSSSHVASSSSSFSAPNSPMMDPHLDDEDDLEPGVEENAASVASSNRSFFSAVIADGAQLLASVQALWFETNFRLLLCVFASLNGLTNSLLVLLASRLSASSSASSSMSTLVAATGATILCVGVLATVVTAGLLSRHQSARAAASAAAISETASPSVLRRAEAGIKKKIVMTALILASLTLLLLALLPFFAGFSSASSDDNSPMLTLPMVLLLCLLGICLLVPQPLLLELSVEVAYPRRAELAAQMLLAGGAAAGLALMAVVWLLALLTPSLASLCCAVLMGVSVRAWGVFEGQERRSDHEAALQRAAELQLGFTPTHAATAAAGSHKSLHPAARVPAVHNLL
jgi:MFS family permease